MRSTAGGKFDQLPPEKENIVYTDTGNFYFYFPPFCVHYK